MMMVLKSEHGCSPRWLKYRVWRMEMTEEQEASGPPAEPPAGSGPSGAQRSRALNEMPAGPPGEPRARVSGPGKAYSPGGPQLGDLGGPLSEDEISHVEEALTQLKELREQIQDAVPTRTSASSGRKSIQDN
jgi:hypothetical protein